MNEAPGTRRPSGNLRLKLNREAKKTIKPIKCDMSNVSDISRPTNLHNPVTILTTDALTPHQRFPENSEQKSQNREVVLASLFLPTFYLLLYTSTIIGAVQIYRSRANKRGMIELAKTIIAWGSNGAWRGSQMGGGLMKYICHSVLVEWLLSGVGLKQEFYCFGFIA